MKRIITVALLGIPALLWAADQPINPVSGGTGSLTEQILRMHSFREGLVLTGNKQPDDAENRELLVVLSHLQQPSWTAELEQFLGNHPHSPWAASLRYDYASFCRRTGRTTKALEQWEAAWDEVRTNTDPQSQRMAGTILANWTDLLSSLGRSEKLQELIAAGDRLHFANGQDRAKFEGAKNSYYLMQVHPGIAYRCGTFALKAVGQAMQPTNQALENLPELPSPTNGFSLAELAELARQRGLDLVAARRTSGQDIIVPSVVHWRQNHYAAILERQGNLYRVDDPTFGQEKFISADVINEEASGEFLIPAALVTNGWTRLDPDLAAGIHGMGLPNNIKDGLDKGYLRDFSGNTQFPQCPGMPIWWVTEPYINVWIADEPISYNTSRGEPFTFRISYKQRDSRPASNTFEISTTGWDNSWLSYIDLESTNSCTFGGECMPALSSSAATLYLPNGGEVDFAPGQSYDPETRLLLQEQTPELGMVPTAGDGGSSGLRLIHADGSQDIYGYCIELIPVYGDDGFAQFLRTRHIDPHGDTTWFQYDILNLDYPQVLSYVVDPDGLTNTLKYNTNNLLSEVDNPYGLSAKFYYDAEGNITNLVDAQGLSSSITYDTNEYPASLTTPYGTTQFSVFENYTNADGNTNGDGNFGGDDLIDRSVLATDPTGATSLYLYRYGAPGLISADFSSSDVPTNTPFGTLDDGNGSGTNSLAGVDYRNSFYWGPLQYMGLSTTNMTNFTANDYLRGRMRHWLEDTNQLYLSGCLSVECDPSPDGSTQGLLKFYDYQGKLSGYDYCAGTNPLPSVMAWCLPGAETHYEYNLFDSFGNITNLITTWTLPNGTLGTRTNQFLFATNTYSYFIGTWDGSGIINTTSTTFFSVPDLLTQVIGADGNPVWSAGGFDTVTWTNFYYTSDQTNASVLSALRVLPDYVTNGVGQAASLSYTGGEGLVTFNDNWPGTPGDSNADYGLPALAAFPGCDKISTATSIAGLTTTNIYATNGFLAQSIDMQIARTNSFGYTSNGLVGSFTNSLGLALSISWDNLLRPIAIQFPDSTYTSNRAYYMDLGGERDRLGNWTTFGYDGARHLIAATNALTNVTQFGWCGCGALTSITNASNQVTTLSYDNQGRMTNVVFPDGSSLSYQFDLAGRMTNVLDGSGRSAQIYYNNQGLPTVVSNSFGAMASVVYDIRDRPQIVTDENGVTVTNTFDGLNRLIARLWPDAIGEGFAYASNGLVAYTNRDQKVVHFGRDTAGRLTAATNANGEVTQFSYDSADNLTNLLDGNSHQTVFQYDQYGRMTNKLNNALNSVLRLAYDPDNRVTNRWMPATGNTAFGYDALANLTNITYSGGPATSPVSLAYDKLNQLISMVDAIGTTAFTYTATCQLQSETGPWTGDTVAYAYSQGQRTNLTIASASAVSYSYDSAWRMVGITSPAGAFGYLPGGASSTSPLIASTSLPNFATITNQYDSLARLTSTALNNYWGHTLDGSGYGYDALGLRTNLTRNLGLTTNSVGIGYDNIGQITGWTAKESGGASRLNEQLGYGYDAADNLHLRTNNILVQTFAADGLNQLSNVTRSGTYTLSGALPAPALGITINGSLAQTNGDFTFARTNLTLTNGANTFTVIATNAYGVVVTNIFALNLPSTVNFQSDSNGNLISDGTRMFLYDAQNQLTNVYVTNQWRSDFVYDGMGRKRIERDYDWSGSAWLKTNETRFVYDGMLVVQEWNTNNVPQVTYTRGLDLSSSLQAAGGIGGLLARTDTNGSTFYHADGMGNITTLIDDHQDIVARYEYDGFGRLVGNWGSLAGANRYQFQSKEFNSPSGLVSFGYRFYEPNFQRWPNRDPLGDVTQVRFLYPEPVSVLLQARSMIPPSEELDGPNLYTFVANSPVSGIDPFGLTCHCDQAGCLAAIADSAIAYGVAALACAERNVNNCRLATLAAASQAAKVPSACTDCGIILGPKPTKPPTWHPVFPVP